MAYLPPEREIKTKGMRYYYNQQSSKVPISNGQVSLLIFSTQGGLIRVKNSISEVSLNSMTVTIA